MASDLPKPVSRTDRRRWQEADERDARRAQSARPNEPPRRSPFTTCHDSRYLTHRFIPTATGRRCAFCRKSIDDCLKRD